MENIKNFLKKVEEQYAVTIKTNLLNLLKSVPETVLVKKNLAETTTRFSKGEYVVERYHNIIMPEKIEAVIFPDRGVIDVKKEGRLFLSFSIQRELFPEISPIIVADPQDEKIIETFITNLNNFTQ